MKVIFLAMVSSGCDQLEKVELYECDWSGLQYIPVETLRELVVDTLDMEETGDFSLAPFPNSA